jgi:hypothetical protein
MSFTQAERDRLARLADVLIPTSDGHPSASDADVGGKGLDLVLATCPETSTALRDLLIKTTGPSPEDAVAQLQSNDPAAFCVLAEFAAGAYFMNPLVREAIGYGGQTARAIDPTADYLDLLEAVVKRGPIYRPTPGVIQK